MKRGAVTGVLAAVSLLAGTAHGQITERIEQAVTARPLAVQVGAGFANTTEGGAKQFTDPGMMWTLRGIWAPRSLIGVEAAYVGSAQSVENLGTGDALLFRNGVEALVRVGRSFDLTARTHVMPYAAAGLGWAFYNIAGEEDLADGVRDNDNVFTTPIGFGVGGGYDAYTLDLRFMFRPVYGDEMFRDVNPGIITAGLNTVTLSAAVGYTF